MASLICLFSFLTLLKVSGLLEQDKNLLSETPTPITTSGDSLPGNVIFSEKYPIERSPDTADTPSVFSRGTTEAEDTAEDTAEVVTENTTENTTEAPPLSSSQLLSNALELFDPIELEYEDLAEDEKRFMKPGQIIVAWENNIARSDPLTGDAATPEGEDLQRAWLHISLTKHYLIKTFRDGNKPVKELLELPEYLQLEEEERTVKLGLIELGAFPRVKVSTLQSATPSLAPR